MDSAFLFHGHKSACILKIDCRNLNIIVIANFVLMLVECRDGTRSTPTFFKQPAEMGTYFWIGLGSGLGGMARYWFSSIIAHRFGEVFPAGTLVVNVTGSFLIGFVATVTDTEGRFLISPHARQFFMVGLFGGYTTFSSFSLQTLNLARDGEWLYAGANIGLSVFLCLGAVWLGTVAGNLINSKV